MSEPPQKEAMETNVKKDVATIHAPSPAATSNSKTSSASPFDRDRRSKRGEKRNFRKSGADRQRVKPEFDQKLITIRRVARVTKGGRRFNFSVALIAGDRKNRVGVGLGKANDTSLAIEKAFKEAKKHMITISLTDALTIPHEVYAKYSSARVLLMPAAGKGLIAGTAARTVLELAGVRNINAKVLSGSKNGLNIARATVKALSKLLPVREASGEKK